MLDIVSYSAIVTLSLRHAVFTIFDFKNVVRGQWYQSTDLVWFPISVQ